MIKVISFISVFPLIIILPLLTACSNDDESNSLANLKTFIDPESTLEWVSFFDANYDLYSYDEILSFCDTLDASGKSDWRMPSADETLDYLVHNTSIYEDTWGNKHFVANQYHDLVNTLNPEPGTIYGSGGSSDIIFKEVPVIEYYDNNQRIYGQLWVNSYFDPNYMPDMVRLYTPDETSALKIISYNYLQDPPTQDYPSFTCVRGSHSAAKIPVGTWVNVENQVEIIGHGQYSHGMSIIDNRHIRLSTVMYEQGHSVGNGNDYVYIDAGLVIDRDAHYISSGIPDARVKGVINSFAEASRTIPRTSQSDEVGKNSVTGIAGIDVILGCIKNYEPQHCQVFTIEPATPENPHNTYTPSTSDSLPNILYVTVDALGNYTLDDDNPIAIATGEVTISLTDSAGNTAVFTVEVAGNDTDVGVLNIPNISTLYNFKTSIDHGTDYIYHGYNTGEAPFLYSKTLSICNVGSANISGTTFTIEVAPESDSLVRSFSHNYDGSSVGFTAGSCENYTVDFDFFRPVEDVEVKFNITISDNFNSLTWKDYTTFRLSQHPPVDVYFASNTQPMEGFLVAPGNKLVRIQFNQYENPQNFVRVSDYPGHEYAVILSTSTVLGEDTYMISTVNAPDRSKMDGFSDVTAHEPNDDFENATIIPLLSGDITSYLHSGDLDFFILKYE